jgi:hypothetical protein
MKTQLLSVVLAAGLAISYIPVASAAIDLTHSFVSSTTDTGNNIIDVLPVPGSFAYTHSFNAPTSTIPGSPGAGFGFYDDFVFQISSASTNSVTSTIDIPGYLGINGLQVRLYNAAGNSFPVLGAPVGCPGVGCTLIDAWSTAIPVGYGSTLTYAVLPTTVLSAGTYVLEVRGNVVGLAGGSYSGVLNIAPVPVPATLWLFGSALAGLVAVRRKAV